MARRIYIKSRSAEEDPTLSLTLVYWIDIPPARRTEFANPTATSVVPDATAAEIQAIRDGAIAERVRSFVFSEDQADRDVLQTLIEYAKHLRREMLGIITPRGTLFRAGLSYDPVTDTLSG